MLPAMTGTQHPSRTSPWHTGERILQNSVGMAARMELVGQKVIRDFMPEQHRAFFAQLPFLLLAAVDAGGSPWATLLEAAPGFVTSPDPRTLRVDALPVSADPAHAALSPGASVGVLGIEPATRRRNRVNGTVMAVDSAGFTLAVEQSFGNCPQYIQTRNLSFARPPGQAADGPVLRSQSLDEAARAAIAAADTFFVASYVDADGDRPRRAVDISHRGGKPGFVRIDGDTLTIPDFSGNLFFNTLGNLLVNPRAGLVFPDFQSGDLLQLTGATELVLEGDEIASFMGAERLWRFRVEQVVRRRGALALRGKLGEYSPTALATGAWPGRAEKGRG